MVESVLMASARIFDIADADENSLLLRKTGESGQFKAEQVTGILEVNSRVYSGHYTQSTGAYIGFSDREDLTGKVFNTMPLVDEATMGYSGFFHLFIKPIGIFNDLEGAALHMENGASRFLAEIFINSTVAYQFGISERQRMLLRLNPLLRPAETRDDRDGFATK